MIYVDTSVLVAYYVPEALSQKVQRRLRSVSAVTVSEFVEVEFASALSLRYRLGDLPLADVQRITALFRRHMDEDQYQTIHLNSPVYRLAFDYLTRFDLPLKAPDALHLAAANLQALTLVTADQQLARNAQTLAIPVDLIEAVN